MSHAFGKVILLGEHAVVYGHPALAGALERGVTVVAKPGSGKLRVPAWQREFTAGDETLPLSLAYQAICRTLGVAPPTEIDFEATFEIPTGAGLGSSAALAVALARALADHHRISHAKVADAALASETVIHGRPSGLDHTISHAGGFGLFTRKDGLAPVAAERALKIVIGHTGRERDTKGRVQRIAELLSERGDEVRARFGAIEKLVLDGARAVGRGAVGELGQAMNENQRHLESLEVSCPEIERMCALAREAGAAGAKLTGGGGGGCVIAVGPEAEIARGWERAGYATFFAAIGAGGAA